MEKIVIIGGGAAGMAAGVFLGEQGHNVHTFEKNEKLGKKLFITGKGRCNLTNSCDEESFFRSVVTNSKFLYSSFYGFTNHQFFSCFIAFYFTFVLLCLVLWFFPFSSFSKTCERKH